ncbi:MAG TPA: AAA family ATPase, partial [Gemmatales bacterium]|nr:AAA family ATPase [Gemmatales bacterium]
MTWTDPPAPGPDVPLGVRDAEPVLRCLAEVEPQPVSWLWRNRVPLGRLTLLVGRPGEGKSFFSLDAAARVSRGEPWPDGAPCPRGSVLLLTAEDDPADTVRPRLDAAGADVARVYLLTAVRQHTADGTTDRMVSLADVAAIEAALERLGDCRLVVVDPIGSFLGGRTDAHRDNEVRAVLAPIAQLAERHGPAVLTVAHRRKSPGSSADDLALGSRAFTGIARSVWHLARDPGRKGRRLLLPGKNNLSEAGSGLAFTIHGKPPRLSWESDPVDMHADDALAAEAQAAAEARKPGPAAEAQSAAEGWLRGALADGPRPAADLADEWRNGRGGSKRTLERARQSLPAEAYRPQNPGPWWWRLPGQEHPAPQDAKLNPKSGELGDLGGVPENTGKKPVSRRPKGHIAKLRELGNVP